MQRITDKQLDSLCEYLNKLTDSPLEYSTREPQPDGSTKFKANIGHYHISHAYGGVCLHRVVNEGGGINTPIISYHAPKRELYNAMQAFIRGLEAVRYSDVNIEKAA